MKGALTAGLLMAALAAFATEPPPGFAPVQVAPGPSVHQLEWERHRAVPKQPEPSYPLLYTVKPEEWQERSPRPVSVTKTVYGFMPTWVVSNLTHVQWDKVSHVAYFSLEMNPDGSLTDLTGSYAWPGGSYVQALLDTAHANKAKVTLATTLFSSTDIATLLSNPAYRQNAIDNLLDKVLEAGADGVNIDFENMPASQNGNLVTFMTALSSAFHSAIPGSHVSIDTPAVDWGGAFNYAALASVCDGLFIMAYDYHWSTSPTAGPCSPLTGGSIWGAYTVTWTVNDYLADVGTGGQSKLILGLPYYGFDYPTTSESVPSSTTGGGDSITYDEARAGAASHGRNWDANSQTPYYTYTSGGAHQGWYDDAESLGLKWDLVNSRGLGGTGMWAMNYDKSDDLLWDQLQAKFGTPLGDLAGKKICLDPGHGGTDSGAIGPTGLEEADVNLAVSLLLRDALLARGAWMYMTRTTDATRTLATRTDYANSIPVDRFESVHHNSTCDDCDLCDCSPDYTGVHVYMNASGVCAASANAKDMAAKTALRLEAALGLGVVSSNCDGIHGVHGDNFYVLHYTSMPAMLTEGSFISNPTEEGLLYGDARRCLEAGAIAKGIEDHHLVSATDPPCAGGGSGTCSNPLAVGAFPYSDSNTTSGKTATMNGYSCAPSVNEAGPEVVYTFTVPLAGSLGASVSEASNVDVDLHVLSACSPSACLVRANTSLSIFLQPGTYFFVVDTWTDTGGTQYAGAYTLNLTFSADLAAPAVPQDLKWSRTSARWEWSAVALDRLGNPETMGHYQMWRGTNPSGSYSLVQDDISATYLADATSPPAGTCWFYQLHAVDAAGNRDDPHLSWSRTYTQASYTGSWSQGASADCDGGTGGYRAVNSAASATATATWSFGVEESGAYAVATRYVQGTNRSTAARYTVSELGSSALVTVNQQANGCTWVSLGTRTLKAGESYTAVLDNQGTPGQYVIADSVRWVKTP